MTTETQTTTGRTWDEHLAWCKQRALAYLPGDHSRRSPVWPQT